MPELHHQVVLAPRFSSLISTTHHLQFLPVALHLLLALPWIQALPILHSAPPHHALSSEEFYSEFRDNDAILSRLHQLSVRRKGVDLAFPPRLETIGVTHQGRQILLARVGRSDASRKILVTAMIHAREWLGGMVAMRLIENYAAPSDGFGSLTDDVELLVVPVGNPDGFEYSKTERLWRKNMQPISNSNCIGVDLNRNWPVNFNGSESVTADPCGNTFPGPAPLSTQEASSLRDLIVLEQNSSTILLHLDIHTYGSLVLGPWAYTNIPPPFSEKADFIGDRIADILTANAVCSTEKPACNIKYLYGSGGQVIYLASGTFTDFTFSLDIMGFTLELREGFGNNASAGGFDAHPTQIIPASETFLAAFRYLVCLSVKNPAALRITPGSPSSLASPLTCDQSIPFETEPVADEPACFPGAAQVVLENGQIIAMRDLMLGDKVLVPGSGPRYSAVYAFSHHSPDVLATFIEIKVRGTEPAVLIVSPGHLVFVSNASYSPARKLRVGDSIARGDGSRSQIEAITKVRRLGLFNPHTIDGRIVVDSFATSSYTTACSPALASVLLLPARICFSFRGSLRLSRLYLRLLDRTRSTIARFHKFLPVIPPVI